MGHIRTNPTFVTLRGALALVWRTSGEFMAYIPANSPFVPRVGHRRAQTGRVQAPPAQGKRRRPRRPPQRGAGLPPLGALAAQPLKRGADDARAAVASAVGRRAAAASGRRGAAPGSVASPSARGRASCRTASSRRRRARRAPRSSGSARGRHGERRRTCWTAGEDRRSLHGALATMSSSGRPSDGGGAARIATTRASACLRVMYPAGGLAPVGAAPDAVVAQRAAAAASAARNLCPFGLPTPVSSS